MPLLAPNYFFGVAQYVPQQAGADSQALIDEIRREFHEGPKNVSSAAETPSGLKTIASVVTAQHDYVMRLEDIEALDGHNDYHLLLKPVRDPQRYRLRQLWINAAGFALDRIATHGNFLIGGVTGVDWTTGFHEIGGAPYIASETTSQPFAIARHAYDSATVAFESIAPAKIPLYATVASFAPNPETGMPPLSEP